jgi:hypothetical protein
LAPWGAKKTKMHLELVVTHESGACSTAHMTLLDAERGARVPCRRATRRAVVCWSLALCAGPCSLPLFTCARPNALVTRAVGGLVARVDTRPLRIHVALARPRLLETLLVSDARCVRAARHAASVACGRRLPRELCERIARFVLGAGQCGLHTTLRKQDERARGPSPKKLYLASSAVPRHSAKAPSGTVLPVSMK